MQRIRELRHTIDEVIQRAPDIGLEMYVTLFDVENQDIFVAILEKDSVMYLLRAMRSVQGLKYGQIFERRDGDFFTRLLQAYYLDDKWEPCVAYGLYFVDYTLKDIIALVPLRNKYERHVPWRLFALKNINRKLIRLLLY